jgi:CRP-like cAMP-binding protein
MAVSFFEGLTDKLKPKTLFLTKGETLFKQKDDVVNIFYLQSGKIQLIRNTIDGTPVILHTGQQSETFAEASLFSNQYHCSAIATLASEIQYVNKKALLEYLEDNPSEMKTLLSIFAGQVRDLRATNEIKNIRSANERILSFVRNNVNDQKEMMLDSSLKSLAYKIGLTHETFYRELKKLEVSGIITRTSHCIKLT